MFPNESNSIKFEKVIKSHMRYFCISLETPLQYHYTGKFEAPSREWIHLSRTMADYELIVVTKGTAYIQLDQQQFSVSEGKFLLCAPTARQAGFQKSDCSFYWLHFDSDKTVDVLESACIPESSGNNRIVIPISGKAENPEKIIVMMKQLQDSVRNYHNRLQNNYLCTGILLEIYCQLSNKQRQSNSDLQKTQLFNDIQDYIKWYRDSDLKVSQIAEHFGYNKRYLSSFFHAASGITLKEYITQKKMEEAKYLLSDTNSYIKEIAFQLGFHDSHTFMKVFKKLVGLTPTQYRNTYSSRLLFYK